MATLTDWWRSLRNAPEPLTPAQGRTFLAVAIVAAVSRWFALARSPWDWDEMLFMLGMRHYDVSVHHPHPPGFPLFIFFADVLHALGLSDFHSLQAISFVAAIAIVPATFFLGRELRLPFATSLIGAALLAFAPNVWLFGGTALSDVPSMTLVIVAVALLLRGARDRRAYFAGAIVLGIAAAFRPQNLLIGFAPALIASAHRKWREVVVATVIGAVIVGGSFGAAAWLTGWDNYRETVKLHQEYITKVDSFRSPDRPPLWKCFDYFFVRPYRATPINAALAFFITISFAVSCVKRRAPLLVTMAAFGPFAFFAWLILDFYSASRFSIGYAPMLAVLAADGIVLLTRRIALVAGAALVLLMIVWTWPALRVVHTTIAPPIAATDWIRAHLDRRTPIYVHGSMSPYADEMLPGWNVRHVMAPPPLPGWYISEEPALGHNLAQFTRSHGHLYGLTRPRYYQAVVEPLTAIVSFGNGWYDQEGDEDGSTLWRWMAARSEARLPEIDGPARIGLTVYVPVTPATITVSINGAVVSRTVAKEHDVDINADVPAARGTHELVITTDRPVVPGHGDTRVLGVRLNEIRWGAR